MKMNVMHRLTAASLLLLALAPLQAESLDPTHIPANPDWLIHVDLDQLKKTKIGDLLFAEMEKPEAASKLEAFRVIFNFDPRRSIRGLTLYGEGTAPADAVLLVLGQFDADRLVTLAKGAEAYESHSHRDYTIHSWLDKRISTRIQEHPRTYGAIHSSGAVIFGQKQARVAQALDVFDARQPSLRGKKLATDLASSSENSFLVAATTRLQLPDSNPNAAMLKRTRSLSLTMGQREQNMVAGLSLQADNEEAAQQILTVGQGLTALLTMQTDNPQAAALGRGLTLAQDGSRVKLTLKLPANQVVEMLQSGAKKKDRSP